MQSEYLGLIMIGLNESHATIVVNQFTFAVRIFFVDEFITQWLRSNISFLLHLHK